jgi:hypothetical protein
MPSGQKVAFEPALTRVFAKDFHHSPVWRQIFIFCEYIRYPRTIRHLKKRAQSVRRRFIRAEHPKVPLLLV